MPEPSQVLAELMALIEDRKLHRPAGSYTTELFDGGLTRIGDKVREEAGEVVAAASGSGGEARRAVIHEAADLLYHLLVLLAHSGAGLTDVETELARRFGVSGLAEKASRRRAQPPDAGSSALE